MDLFWIVLVPVAMLAFLAGMYLGWSVGAVTSDPPPARVGDPVAQPSVTCVLLDKRGEVTGTRTLRATAPPLHLHRYHGRGPSVTYVRQDIGNFDGRVRYREVAS